jgi:hypothetical protein
MQMFQRWMTLLLVAITASGCSSGSSPQETPTADVVQTSPDQQADERSTVDLSQGTDQVDLASTEDGNGADVLAEILASPPARVVAMGDLHGDLEAARRAFKLAGVIDTADHWIGGIDVVVQTGDILDRWSQERELMDWMEALQVEARQAGGDIVMLAGNHEDNNLEEYYPDVDPDACPAFADVPDDPSLASPEVSPECKKRAAALLPGGTYAMKIANWKVAAIVGDSAFVHGGLLPQYVSSPESIDSMNARWTSFAKGESGPDADEDIYECMWDRSYSDDDVVPNCKSLSTLLASLGVSRMVVGHTRWPHINSACDGKVWRIDTGMSSYYGGNVEVLEIAETAVTPLAE